MPGPPILVDYLIVLCKYFENFRNISLNLIDLFQEKEKKYHSKREHLAHSISLSKIKVSLENNHLIPFRFKYVF